MIKDMEGFTEELMVLFKKYTEPKKVDYTFFDLEHLDWLIDDFRSFVGRKPTYLVMSQENRNNLVRQLSYMLCYYTVGDADSDVPDMYNGIKILIDNELSEVKCV